MEVDKKILSELVVYMKYARYLPELKRRETWEEIVDRNMQMHIKKFSFLKEEIEHVYNNYILTKRILPSMRSLQFAGLPSELNPARLYNCCYSPIDNMVCFSEAMFLLLSGCGYGYSVQKHHVDQLPEIIKPLRTRRYLVADSIIGWSDAIKTLIHSYFTGKPKPLFDFRDIRQKGMLLVTSGGKAPGPEPLKRCLFEIEQIFENKQNGDKLKTIDCHSMMCHIADSVLSGGIRRSSCIALFSTDDEDMMCAKTGNWWEINPHFARANNSVVIITNIITKEEFDSIWLKVENSGSGEPGFSFTNDPEYGFNPCLSGDTVVETADGRSGITIKQLAEESDGKIRFPVFCAKRIYQTYQSWETEVKQAVAFKTGTKPLLRIHLSDGTSFRCTRNHKLALADGSWVEAKDSLNAQLTKIQLSNIIDTSTNDNRLIHVTSVNNTTPVYVIKLVDTGLTEDVYDLTVEDNHNFYIITKADDGTSQDCSGILVHNCHEASLRSNTFCNLTEINADLITSQEDFNDVSEKASFVNTLQSSYTDFIYLRSVWKQNTEKDALIGVGITGIGGGNLDQLDKKQAAACVVKENERVSKLIGINKAARCTIIKPGGTSSLVLGTSSGIHAYHNDFYIRRLRVNKNESIYTYLQANHPELVEDDLFSPKTLAIISIPQKAPSHAHLRTESAIHLLNRVKDFNLNWIGPGHRNGSNRHNVSATISIKPSEWKEVGEWFWENKHTYHGLSVIPFNDHIYKQAPFEDCSNIEYHYLFDKLKDLNLSQITETEDVTNHTSEGACSGGSCELK